MAEVSLKIGDMVHTPGGRDGRIAGFSHDNKKAMVKFVFGKQHGWYEVADCELVQSPLTRSAAAPNGTEAYPVGKLMKNVAGETVRVISQWKDMVKLQPGGVVELTEFEPKGEPFTLSEQDVQEWLLKWLKPGDVVEMVDGRIVILREMRLNEQIPAVEQREYRLGVRFASENPLAQSVGTIYAESIKSKVTTPVAEAFRILAEPGNPNQLQQTIDSLRTEVTLLHRENDKLKATPPIPGTPQAGREQSDELMKAVEDAAKSKAALLDAESRIRNLEYKNQQQVKMLREASAALPQNANHNLPTQRIMTLVSVASGDSMRGFDDVVIPKGHQLAAITTSAESGVHYRFIHLIGCCDDNNQPLYEEKTERIPVMDDMPENSFEAALRGDLSPEAVIAIGNERVIDIAWEAAQSRRAANQSRIPIMLKGGQS